MEITHANRSKSENPLSERTRKNPWWIETMLVDGIKSRPRYNGLSVNKSSRNHVFVADGDGVNAIADLFAVHSQDIGGHVTIVFAEHNEGKAEHAAPLESISADSVHIMPSIPTAINRLAGVLHSARMGTQIYASGTEALIGLTIQLAQAYGMDPQSVITEHRGSFARRVQCVHCKGFTEDVRTNIVECAHCRTNLLVRDHYSIRHAAFQGVCVDAEVPGDLPQVIEAFK
ncbi:dimethylamine monooxygenase subunit DmmA family protein [Hyphomicrobium sp.]|uniref:dimethylamine monooxygenase subunit DmmA family protein n=1 Tax=Hyphomicrobium sp. TaxID=82 RepID=UPI002E33A7BC|nr:dimethylamine monooxygenase subunit DmmA family protein [Hyphomicrobium sp.]HEX2840034.1 dimethylamine monooxygenase subunit DmmA family protein [Hyphomicrobium sp.]